MVEYEMTGNKPRSMPEREHAWPIYDIFETAGGERIFIGVVTEGHWQSFCREFGMTEFLDDPALRTTTDRILARSRIIPRAAEVIKQCNAAELSAKHSDVHLFWGDTVEQIVSNMKMLRGFAATHGRENDLGFGMRLQIVCRENEKDAWDAAIGLVRNVTAERTNYIQT